MSPTEAFEELKKVSKYLEYVPYDTIMSLLKDSIQRIPIAVAKIPKNTIIERARKNKGEELYTSVYDELSYIKDQYVIDHYMEEFGRANKPRQPMFYGAFESTLMDKARGTALAETSDLFVDRNAISFAGELYTFSRWRTTEDLFVAEMVFAKQAIEVNPDTKRAFERQTEFAKDLDEKDIDFFQEFLVFISEEFAREKVTHNDYKISTAYADLILSKRQDLVGVTYPSVRIGYIGQNIVLPPHVVDKYLKIDVLSTQRLHKNKMNAIITNHKDCLNPYDNPNPIQWADLHPSNYSSTAEIEAHLNQPQPVI